MWNLRLGKYQEVMADVTCDRPGDVVADCCAGGSTHLLAAVMEGRRAVGSECDPDTHAKATARLSRGFQPSLLVPQVRAVGVQDKLL